MKADKVKSIPIIIAGLISVILVAAGAYIFVVKDVFELQANAIGDFLAGFAGTLSFVWIITTILLQRDELILQREELSLQRKETTRLADESKIQSQALLASARMVFTERWEMTLIRFYQSHKKQFLELQSKIEDQISVEDQNILDAQNNFDLSLMDVYFTEDKKRISLLDIPEVNENGFLADVNVSAVVIAVNKGEAVTHHSKCTKAVQAQFGRIAVPSNLFSLSCRSLSPFTHLENLMCEGNDVGLASMLLETHCATVFKLNRIGVPAAHRQLFQCLIDGLLEKNIPKTSAA